MFAMIPGVIEHIRSGALRSLAVTTVMRSESLPGVPTVGDHFLGYEANEWYGVGARAGTPKSIIEELHRVVNIALAGATLKARIADLGGTPLAVSQSELAQLVAEDTERWAKVVKFSGAKPD